MARIIIVEDDPILLRMYEQAFTFERHEVEVAQNGKEALEKIAVNPPTLILLDVMMPVMNGFETLEKLKADSKSKNIPVVMLTNLSEQKDAEEALSKGAVKYIVKGDVSPKLVVEMVKEILNAYTHFDAPKSVLSA